LEQDWRRFVEWVRSIFLRFPHLAPLATLALLVVARITSSKPLRTGAYCIVIILLLTTAADLARSFIDQGAAETSFRDVPPNLSQILLAALLGATYALAILSILGVWTPMVIPPVFVISCLAAWRNVRLWYCQGQDYKNRLKEAEEVEKLRLNHSPRREY
jgi:hypothetical protein